MALSVTDPQHPYQKSKRCVCDDCLNNRGIAPPVTDEMRAKWAAMGLEVTKTPKKTSRQDYKRWVDVMPGRDT